MKVLRLAAMALAIAMGAAYTIAQSETNLMQVKLTDGTQFVYNVGNIDKMEIEPSANIEIGGHEYVDLGLSSGTLWATCNVGGSHPTDCGNYYAYGETTIREDYNSEGSWYGVSYSALKSEGVIDASGNLMPEYDAATAEWGSLWHTPTSAEMQELINFCSFKWTTVNGRYGCIITGPNHNTIFLPAAGYRVDYEFKETIYEGYYLGSTARDDDEYSYYLWFNNVERRQVEHFKYRFVGMPIRPVTKKYLVQ